MPDDPTPPSGAARRSHLIDVTPLRVSPAFARLWFGNTLSGIGAVMTSTAVGLHIYDLTGSTFMVSLVAWFALLPLPVAAIMVALALLAWRTGVRKYTSTGS